VRQKIERDNVDTCLKLVDINGKLETLENMQLGSTEEEQKLRSLGEFHQNLKKNSKAIEYFGTSKP
jgi:hypothetical protein